MFPILAQIAQSRNRSASCADWRAFSIRYGPIIWPIDLVIMIALLFPERQLKRITGAWAVETISGFFKPFEQRVNERNPLVKLRVLLSVNLRLCLAVASQRTCEEKLGHFYLQLVWRCPSRSEMMFKATIQSDTPRQLQFSIVIH